LAERPVTRARLLADSLEFERPIAGLAITGAPSPSEMVAVARSSNRGIELEVTRLPARPSQADSDTIARVTVMAGPRSVAE